MTTPTGQISWSNITAEFGAPPGKNLGAYRVSQTIGDRSWPLDSGVPTSGAIKFSDLRGKTCNVIVDYGSGDDLIVGSDSSLQLEVNSLILHAFNDTSNQNIYLSSSNEDVVVEIQSPTDVDGTTPLDVAARKHYLVTINNQAAGFDVGSTVQNIDIIDVQQFIATTDNDISRARTITVSKKEKVSANQFRLWFYAVPNAGSEPGAPATSNNYCRGFTIRWSVTETFSGSSTTAKTLYNTTGVVVGGFKTKANIEASGSTQKVTHLVRRRVGGGFDTGSWSSGTALNFLITANGGIIGRGGRGGNAGGNGGYGSGTTPASPSQQGRDGTPALFARYSCSITLETSSSRLQAGGGGGGGGGGGCGDPDDNPQDPVTGGGGGGGGAGLPAGEGGKFGGNAGAGSGGSAGNNGTLSSGGKGGNGGTTANVQGPRDCTHGGGGGGGAGPTEGAAGSAGNSGCGQSAPFAQEGQITSGGRGGRGVACRRNSGSRLGGTGGASGKSVLALPGIVVNISNPGGGVLYGQQGTESF